MGYIIFLHPRLKTNYARLFVATEDFHAFNSFIVAKGRTYDSQEVALIIRKLGSKK